MEFTETVEDDNRECSVGSGNVEDITTAKECRCFCPDEDLCIFPFYYNGKLYDQCAYLENEGYLVQGPIYRCPTRNITRKIDGISSFTDKDFIKQVRDFRNYPKLEKIDSTDLFRSTILVCV